MFNSPRQWSALRRAFLLACLLTCAQSSHGSTPSLFDLGDRHFESFQALESFDADIVMDIQQGPSGFIWLATQKGLLRYDGHDFRTYVHDENDPTSISGDDVRAMEFVDDKLWIGTYSDGVSVFDPRTDSFTRIQADASTTDGLYENDIRALARAGNWIVIASRGGISLFDLSTDKLSRLGNVNGCEELLMRGQFSSLASDGDRLLVGTATGLCRIDIAGQDLAQAELRGLELEPLAGQRIFNIEFLASGQIWVATETRGIAVLDPGMTKVRWIAVDEDNPNSLHNAWIDDTTLIQGAVWAATAGAGIAVIDPLTLEVREHLTQQPTNPHGLNLNDVSAIFEDRSGVVWVGTWGGGMNRYNPANRAFKVLRANPYEADALADSDIRSIKEMRNGDVWIGGATSGIQVVRPGAGLLKTYPPRPGVEGALHSGYIYAFEQLPDGEIWVSTNQSGVYRYRPARDDFEQFTTDDGLTDNQVRTLYVDDDDTLWLGTDNGLTRYDAASQRFTAVGLQGSVETAFDEVVETITSHEGNLWVGTSSGLFVLPAGSDELVPAESDPAAPLSDNFIADLTVDSRGQLWVSTSQGIDILSAWDGRRASFSSVNQLLRLPRRSLGEALEEDSLGRIWAQSTLIDPRDWSHITIDRSAGWAVGNQWIGSNTKLRDGTIIFAGTRGLLMVRPELYQRQHYTPPVVITRGEVDARHLSPAQLDPLVLDPAIKSFSIEFAALDYGGAAANQYRYMLEGYDDVWVTTGPRNRRATYSRLSPGNYVLRIRATNSFGVWGDEETTVRIQQLAAWYETLWFKALLLAISAWLLYALYRRRVKQLKRQKRALDRLVEERTENIRQLAKAGQDITSSLDFEQVLSSIYTHVGEFMDTTVFAIGLLEEQSQTLHSVLHYQEGQEKEGFTRVLDDEHSVAARCVRRNEVVVASSAEELRQISSELRLIERSQPIQSLVFLPMQLESKVIGFLSVQSYEPAAYGANEVQMLMTIASYAASAISNAESLNQLSDAKAEIERISLSDQLTGLYNRRFLEQLLPGETNNLQRLIDGGSELRLGVILLDADHFKQINDRYGHQAGDRVLVQLGGLLKSICREMDWAIRFGGEEFLVLAKVTSTDQLLLLAERIRLSIREQAFELADGTIVRRTCSMGICQYPFIATHFSAVSWEQTLQLADQALYMAKRSGRDRWIALLEQRIDKPTDFYDEALGNLEAAIASKQVTRYSSADPQRGLMSVLRGSGSDDTLSGNVA
ncbi:MAG: diguanylate cyclase [Pseudomonadota bacterium]